MRWGNEDAGKCLQRPRRSDSSVNAKNTRQALPGLGPTSPGAHTGNFEGRCLLDARVDDELYIITIPGATPAPRTWKLLWNLTSWVSLILDWLENYHILTPGQMFIFYAFLLGLTQPKSPGVPAPGVSGRWERLALVVGQCSAEATTDAEKN